MPFDFSKVSLSLFIKWNSKYSVQFFKLLFTITILSLNSSSFQELNIFKGRWIQWNSSLCRLKPGNNVFQSKLPVINLMHSLLWVDYRFLLPVYGSSSDLDLVNEPFKWLLLYSWTNCSGDGYHYCVYSV